MAAIFFWLASRALSRWLPRAIVSIKGWSEISVRGEDRSRCNGTGKSKRKMLIAGEASPSRESRQTVVRSALFVSTAGEAVFAGC